MEGEQVIVYLESLGQELIRRGFSIEQPIEILVAGGTYMVLNIGNRSSTEDIDVLFLESPGDSEPIDLTSEPSSKREKALRTAIRAVARLHKLKQSWFNDDAGPFLREAIPRPTKIYWRDFGPLRAYFPSKEAMLVYKLMGYSPKQQNDIYVLSEELGLKSATEIQSVVDKYVDARVQREYVVQKTIARLFA